MKKYDLWLTFYLYKFKPAVHEKISNIVFVNISICKYDLSLVDFSDLKVQTCSAREESAPEAPRRTPRGGTARKVEQWQEMWEWNKLQGR